MNAAPHNSDQRLVLLIGLVLIGLVICWKFLYPQTALTPPQPSQVKAVTPVPMLEKIIPTEPMLPEKPDQASDHKPATHPRIAKIDASQALLAGKSMQDGHVPIFLGKIDMPFNAYLQAMEELGCRLTGYETMSQRVAGYFHAGQLVQKPMDGKFSSQARDVTGDMPPSLRDKYLALLREKTGPGSYRIMLVIPSDVQARFVGSLGIMMKRAGFDPAQIESVEYRYSKQGSDLVLHMDSIRNNQSTALRTSEAAVFSSIKSAN